MPTLECGMSYPKFFDSVLCYSSTTQINSSKLATCPVSLSSSGIASAYFISFPARSMSVWLSECRNLVPQLTGLNDLLVKRAAEAAALTDRETYLTLRCCSIFALTSLAQLYDIISRSSIIPPHESIRFRGICDDTLKDIAKITVDFTKDDYSFLEPFLSVSPPTWNRHSTEKPLGELDTCVEPCGWRRPTVIPPVHRYSFVRFPRPRKSAVTHPHVP